MLELLNDGSKRFQYITECLDSQDFVFITDICKEQVTALFYAGIANDPVSDLNNCHIVGKVDN